MESSVKVYILGSIFYGEGVLEALLRAHHLDVHTDDEITTAYAAADNRSSVGLYWHHVPSFHSRPKVPIVRSRIAPLRSIATYIWPSEYAPSS